MTLSAPSRVEFERNDDPLTWVEALPGTVRFLYIPYRRYLMIDGTGAPGSSAFKAAIGALYPVAYTLHFALKARGVSAPVGALEGLYWIGMPGPMPSEFFEPPTEVPPMQWRLLMPVPEQATDAEIQTAILEVAAKRPNAALKWLRCEGWLEGECAQTLHLGPYDAEYPTIRLLLEKIDAAGLRPRGCHHEIYMSSPATSPARFRSA